MKKRWIFSLFIACVMLFVACEKSEEVMSEPVLIELSQPTVVMERAKSSQIEFTVSPSNATFNYDIKDENCQIALEILSSEWDEPLFSLTKVEPVANEMGKYRATIKDLRKSNDYIKQGKLVITDSQLNKIYSEVINFDFTGTSLFSFSFLKEQNEGAIMQDFNLNVSSNTLNVSSPFISSPRLVATFETNAEKVLVNNEEQVSGKSVVDFSSPVIYHFISATGKEMMVQVNVSYSGLPIVIINTPNNATIPSKHSDWLENATITILNPDGTESYSGTTSIRGRGNATWNYPKKPFNLKLDKKSEILGMPKHKRWVMLANWMDRTLMRNKVAFRISESTGLVWTPRNVYVEVILNGEHVGNYLLCEHVKVDENRVNIQELEEDDVDGGYLMELEAYYDEEFKFKSKIRDLPYMFSDPDEVNEEQFAFMQNYINEMEASLYDDERFAQREYLNYLDIDSHIDWWLVQELTRNWEPNHPRSTFMYKDKGGKLYTGPVWDFDWNTFIPSTGYTNRNAMYYGRLFQDKAFDKRVKERWEMFKSNFDEIPAYIDSIAAYIAPSEKLNHTMWPIGQDVNHDEALSFEEAVKLMKDTYIKKVQWFDTQY